MLFLVGGGLSISSSTLASLLLFKLRNAIDDGERLW
jgi:hypothetical protein